VRLAFAGDDVQAEFAAAKAAEVGEELPPADVAAPLPGWGQWAGRSREPAWLAAAKDKALKCASTCTTCPAWGYGRSRPLRMFTKVLQMVFLVISGSTRIIAVLHGAADGHHSTPCSPSPRRCHRGDCCGCTGRGTRRRRGARTRT